MTLSRALVVATALTVPSSAAAAPVLASAAIRIEVSSPTSCEVTMALRIDGASEVEHRLEAFEDASIEIDEIRGGRPIGEPRGLGRTRSLVVRVDQPDYQLRYRARQGDARRERCPLWVPAVPTSGQMGAVRLEIHLPPGARPSSSMPALAWNGVVGTATIAHLPAFVRVPYAAAGEPTPWDLMRVMDGFAIAAFAGASAIWIWRRRARWA